jgi:peptidoglycan/LPS O-acetylase OafA/YrhL
MPRGRIAVVEALRGVAAISVALFHFSIHANSGILVLFHEYGWLGVDVFFVISGFVIPLSLFGRAYSLRDFPDFMLRRLIRLEPAYLASIALGLVLWRLSSLAPGFRGTDPNYSIGQIASHFLYAIPLTHYEWISPVYWSLAYEFVFYILVGLTFAFLIRRPIEWTVIAIAVASSGLWLLQSKTDVRVLEFAIGVLLMRAVIERGARTWFWLVASVALVWFIGGTVIGVTVTCAAASIVLFRDASLGRWAYLIGGASYSLYLTHVAVGGRMINLGERFGSGALYETCLVFAALGISLLFAGVFCYLVERPSLRLSRLKLLRAVIVPSKRILTD